MHSDAMCVIFGSLALNLMGHWVIWVNKDDLVAMLRYITLYSTAVTYFTSNSYLAIGNPYNFPAPTLGKRFTNCLTAWKFSKIKNAVATKLEKCHHQPYVILARVMLELNFEFE